MKQLLHCPYSACGCYDGRHFCSRLLSFLFFIRYAQRCNDNCEKFEKRRSENSMLLQNVTTLIENVVDVKDANKKLKLNN